MRFVVVTGMSGGGKRTALKLLEDAGFYCVDNLPVSLVEKFVELIAMPGSEISKVALGLDVRADQNFMDATRILEQLKEKGYKFEILFMDSDDAALIKRYKETRRVHPLAADGRVEDGILCRLRGVYGQDAFFERNQAARRSADRQRAGKRAVGRLRRNPSGRNRRCRLHDRAQGGRAHAGSG